MKKKGFTLIELLVVISIIALLLAILLPALGKAKDHAKKIGCSANLRSLSLAAIFYATDNDDLTPSSSNIWADNGITRAGWVGLTSDNNGDPFSENVQVFGNGSDDFTGLHKSQLWNYIENTKGWHCPTDPKRDQLRSYCMAAEWWGRHTTSDNSISYDTSSAPSPKVYRKISAIRNASARFLFVDQLGTNIDAYAALWYSYPYWWNIPNILHGGGSVNAFADGHVEHFKFEKETVSTAKTAMDDPAAGANGFKMPMTTPLTNGGIEDLKYYQRATWGEISPGWT